MRGGASGNALLLQDQLGFRLFSSEAFKVCSQRSYALASGLPGSVHDSVSERALSANHLT